MKIKSLIQAYGQALQDRYGQLLLPGHKRALDAMLACRSHCGEFYRSCCHCPHQDSLPLSCGHRSCPQCQHHLGERWLERQQEKMLPTVYYMVTFTLPKELRNLLWQHQSILYDILIQAAIEALQTVGKNNYALQLGMTAVLHTHKRDKGYHPHVHIMLPGLGIPLNPNRGDWKHLPQDFLINEMALAQIFRGIFYRKLFEQPIDLPYNIPKKWVCHIRNVGRGEKALQYLSRYLYRGVISENDIWVNEQGEVTFQYQDSKTKLIKTKKLDAEDFLWRILRHVLPRRFRRVRDYGFLHGNAKHRLEKVQAQLNIKKEKKQLAKPKTFSLCKVCCHPMRIEMVIPQKIPHLFLRRDDTLAPPN